MGATRERGGITSSDGRGRGQEQGARANRPVRRTRSLPGLAESTPAMTSPGDLLQELLHRCDYWTPAPRRRATLDRPAGKYMSVK